MQQQALQNKQPAPLEVLFEDAHITVCVKAPGMASEDAPGGVPALLRARWQQPGAYVGVVHRLDKAVGGVMVYARTPAAAAALSRQMAAAQSHYAAQPAATAAPGFVKRYRAVVAGAPDEALPGAGQLQDLLFKDSRSGKVYCVARPRKGVRAASLSYRVLATASWPPAGQTGAPGFCSLVEVVLHTGRTHQIRVQFASRRHPLWGDGRYGSRQKGALALQCAQLCFDHPATGQRQRFAVPMPPGMPWALFAAPAGERGGQP